jgi:hypothetical protein
MHIRQARETGNAKRRSDKRQKKDQERDRFFEEGLVKMKIFESQAVSAAEQGGPDSNLNTGRAQAFQEAMEYLKEAFGKQ